MNQKCASACVVMSWNCLIVCDGACTFLPLCRSAPVCFKQDWHSVSATELSEEVALVIIKIILILWLLWTINNTCLQRKLIKLTKICMCELPPSWIVGEESRNKVGMIGSEFFITYPCILAILHLNAIHDIKNKIEQCILLTDTSDMPPNVFSSIQVFFSLQFLFFLVYLCGKK